MTNLAALVQRCPRERRENTETYSIRLWREARSAGFTSRLNTADVALALNTLADEGVITRVPRTPVDTITSLAWFCAKVARLTPTKR